MKSGMVDPDWHVSVFDIIIIIVYPLTARVVGAPQMILQPVFFLSIFPCSPPPSGTCRTPGLSIPWQKLIALESCIARESAHRHTKLLEKIFFIVEAGRKSTNNTVPLLFLCFSHAFFSLKYRQKCRIKLFSPKGYAVIFRKCQNVVNTEKLPKSILY